MRRGVWAVTFLLLISGAFRAKMPLSSHSPPKGDSLPRLNNTAVRLAWSHKYGTALQLLQRAAAARPTDTVLYNQAIVLGRLQRYDEAASLLQSIPTFHLAQINQGIYQCRNGQIAAGLVNLESVAAGKGTAAEVAYNRAVAHYTQKAYTEAGRNIDQALRIRGGEPTYRLLKADVLMTQQKYREALSIYRSLERTKELAQKLPVRMGNALVGLKQYDEATEVFEDYLKSGDRSAQFSARLGLGNALYGLKDFQRATYEYRQAALLHPQDVLAHTGLGNALCSQRDYKGARQSYETALHLDSTNRHAHLGLGVVSTRQGMYEEALERFEQAGDLFTPSDPALADCYLSRGLAMMEMNKSDAALPDFQTVIRLNRDHPAAYAGISDVFRKKDSFRAAIEYIDRAISRAPDNDRLLTNKGGLYLKVDQMDAAHDSFSWALNHNVRNVNSLNGIALAWLEKDQIDRAEALYDSLIARGHRKAFLYNNRGIVRSYKALRLEKDKQLNQSRQYFYRSLQDFKKAQQIDSTRKFYQNNIGNVYKNIREYDNAMRSYQAYLSKTAINNMGVMYASNANGRYSRHYLDIAISLDSTHRAYQYNRYKVYEQFYKDSLRYRPDVLLAKQFMPTQSISAKYSRDGYINIYTYDYDFDRYDIPGDHFFPIRTETPPAQDFRPLDDMLLMDVKAERSNSRVTPPVQVKTKRMPKSPRIRGGGSTKCPKL